MNKKSEKGRRGVKFSAREVRAVLLMLPLVAVLVWIVAVAVRPRFDDSAVVLGDTIAGGDANSIDMYKVGDDGITVSSFSEFDPNEVTYEELRTLGIPKNTAAGIIRYRKAGKVFRIPEDFAACYGVSDSMYAVLKPYIIIGAEYAVKPKHASDSNYKTRFDDSPKSGVKSALTSFDPNELSAEGFVALGFSPKQAQVIINFRKKIGGFGSAADFAKCFVVSDAMFVRLRDYIVIRDASSNQSSGKTSAVHNSVKASSPVEINSADSAQLVSVRGIGAKTAAAIIAYRKRLGGYYDAAQICETGVVSERNWDIIKEQIWADSCAIQKIDINFVAPNTVGKHPYLGGRILRKLLRNRQLKGGWSTIEDMLKDNTLTAEEAKKLAPYLQFRAIAR